ncbi:unnamed protein product [Hymenolepis diminuta]|uniref:GMC_OxRdtase_N domain-containing protein n=1 Tax=Hymenolepis diminuta TaxID=6216 RepID=A0A0R3SX37_HYMDI|nr:unnamed protein product [Hymenolepis diminuta]
MSGPRLLILFQSSLETDIHVETSVLLMLSLLPFDILSHKSGKLICNSQHLKLVFELLDGHDIGHCVLELGGGGARAVIISTGTGTNRRNYMAPRFHGCLFYRVLSSWASDSTYPQCGKRNLWRTRTLDRIGQSLDFSVNPPKGHTEELQTSNRDYVEATLATLGRT